MSDKEQTAPSVPEQPKSRATTPKAAAVLGVVSAIGAAIKDLKRVPNGHLYAMVMGKMTLESYTMVIDILVTAGVVEIKNNELVWVGKP